LDRIPNRVVAGNIGALGLRLVVAGPAAQIHLYGGRSNDSHAQLDRD
jgi:hypothetical protein